MGGLIICIILLIIISSKDDTRMRNAEEHAHHIFDNTNFAREEELYHEFWFKRKRLDGTAIPLDYSYISIWNEVDKQLKKEGLRLSPLTCNLANYKFDEKGYVINPHKR